MGDTTNKVGWQFVRTDDGSPTLRHSVHGEACHSQSGAWLEARERYARACCLTARAQSDATLRAAGRLRLLDVGTGLGWNLAAALEALAGTPVSLDATTFESERSVIERALFPDVLDQLPADARRFYEPIRTALREALALSGTVTPGADQRPPQVVRPVTVPILFEEREVGRLTLVLGDARVTLRETAGSFDAVFLDAFSPRVDPALWETSFLGEIARRMAPGSWLSTYTVSLAVRARLMAHGLRVGPGAAVGAKRAGTLARPSGELARFDRRTEQRLARRAEAEREANFPFEAGGADPRMT